MAFANNILQNVQTYQLSGLALLQNLCCFIGTANTKFKDFDRITNQLGSTVNFDLPPRFTYTNSLVASFQAADQRLLPLTVDQQGSVSYSFSATQFIFQARDYMERWGRSAIAQLGAKVELNVAQNCVSNTYRFFGDGVTPINSFLQLAQALAFFRNFGSAPQNVKGYLSDIAVPQIVNSGLNQFSQDRNNKMSMSWQLGEFSNCEWYQSNLLPVHIAGNVGINGTVLTVTNVTPNSEGAVVAITFSGATPNDAFAVKKYDKFQFQDGVAGQPNMRFLTFIGQNVSANPVQFTAIADAAADGGGNVTVILSSSNNAAPPVLSTTSLFPPLQANVAYNQNINNQIAAGMQVKALPSHRAGLICSDDPLFLAMPQLPDQAPYATGNEYDPDTGVSIRQYYGSLFGMNQQAMVHDCIWGSTLVPDNSLAIIFPL